LAKSTQDEEQNFRLFTESKGYLPRGMVRINLMLSKKFARFVNPKKLRRNLDDQIKVLQQHMSATANALNEIKVLIPKKLASEVTDASKNKVFEFLTGEWADSSESQNDNDATFVLKIDDIRQLELETSPRHSKVIFFY
jgi:uncharacterized protein YktB (UPF0637 family)